MREDFWKLILWVAIYLRQAWALLLAVFGLAPVSYLAEIHLIHPDDSQVYLQVFVVMALGLFALLWAIGSCMTLIKQARAEIGSPYNVLTMFAFVLFFIVYAVFRVDLGLSKDAQLAFGATVLAFTVNAVLDLFLTQTRFFVEDFYEILKNEPINV
jgi:hypothetical protein